MTRINLCGIAACIVLGACTGPTGTGSSGDSTTTRRSIVATVRNHLIAVAESDYASRVDGTVGELAAWNRWIEAAGYQAGVEQARLVIERLRPRRVGETTARVALQATLRFTTGKRVRLSGPVLLRRQFGVWKVVDYRRSGLSQRKAIVSGVEGRASQDGVTLQAVGWVLQRDYVDVFIRVKADYESVEPLGAHLIAPSGEVLRRGTDGPTANGFMSVHVEGTGRTHGSRGRFGNPGVLSTGGESIVTDYYWVEREINQAVRKLRLVLNFATEGPADRVQMTLAMRRDPT